MPNDTLKSVRCIIAISSCKGGVGKSTLAAHLAQELARRGSKVGLVDTDIHGPSIPTLFNLQSSRIHVNAEKQLVPIEKNGLKIMSFGFLLGDEPAVLRGPIVSRYVQQILQNTAWGELDHLLIDMPPGTGDIQLTITQHVRLNGAVIITTPQTLSLLDVSRGILMFEKVNVPILGVIENMSYFLCDQCNKKHHIFGTDSAKTLKERFGVETLAEIPILEQMILNIDKPIINSFIVAAADKIIAAVQKEMTTPQTPPAIHFDEKEVRLKWENEEGITISNRDLRLSCRCALCANELTGKRVFTEKNLRPNIAAKNITPLGNYALKITWNDGHSSGIYPYTSIKPLAHKKEHA